MRKAFRVLGAAAVASAFVVMQTASASAFFFGPHKPIIWFPAPKPHFPIFKPPFHPKPWFPHKPPFKPPVKPPVKPPAVKHPVSTPQHGNNYGSPSKFGKYATWGIIACAGSTVLHAMYINAAYGTEMDGPGFCGFGAGPATCDHVKRGTYMPRGDDMVTGAMLKQQQIARHCGPRISRK